MVDLRDRFERAKLIEQLREQNAETCADMERRRLARTDGHDEPIGRPRMQKKDAAGALVYKEHFSATGEAAAGDGAVDTSAEWVEWFGTMLNHELQHGNLLPDIAEVVMRLVDERVVSLERKIRQLERKLVTKSKARRT